MPFSVQLKVHLVQILHLYITNTYIPSMSQRVERAKLDRPSGVSTPNGITHCVSHQQTHQVSTFLPWSDPATDVAP